MISTSQRRSESTSKNRALLILFFVILGIGILVRVWQFGVIPQGLNKDEASIGVDAMSLLRYGVDRNGMSFPVHFTSWGSGQNALYGYMLMPFLAIFGSSSTIFRLPMLLSGIATLPLVYLVGKEIEDEKLGLLAMFFVAVSPWHIILSRWALESNLLPFVFLVSFVLLIKSIKRNNLFPFACLFFGLCLYAYGSAYAFIPIFVSAAFGWLLYKKQIRLKPFLAGVFILFIVALPILSFVATNTLKHGTLHLFAITVPRLPSLPRYESISFIFQKDALKLIGSNLITLLTLLIEQTDHNVINVIEPYGYFYLITFPFAVIGIWQLIRSNKQKASSAKIFLLIWITAAFIIGMIQPVNINRVNIIFIPLIIFIAVFIYNASKGNRWVLPLSSLILLAACILFMHDYLGEKYLNKNHVNFFIGLEPSILYANSISQNEICITAQYHGVTPASEVYVLLADPMNPADYLSTIDYVDPHAEFRVVRSMGRYSFGLNNCKKAPTTVYIFYDQDNIPQAIAAYNRKDFGDYVVFSPNIPQ